MHVDSGGSRPVAVVLFGRDGDIEYLNTHAASVLNRAEDTDSIGNLFQRFGSIGPQLAETTANYTGGIGTLVEDQSVRIADGATFRWCSWSVACIGADSFLLTVVDSGASDLTPAGLRESRLRSVFESIDQAFCVCEILLDIHGNPVDYRFLEINHLFEKFTGLVKPVGRTALEMVPDLEPVWVQTFARVALDQECLRFRQRSDALGRSFDVFALPLQPRGCFAVMFKDDTSQHLAEAAIRESEQRFRYLADQLPLMVWVVDGRRRLTWVNHTLTKYFGFSREEICDRHWRLETHPDDGGSYLSALTAAIEARESFHREVLVLHADGEWRWIESWAEPQLDESGAYAGHLGASADVNERIVAEQHLAQIVVRERATRQRVELLQRNAINLAAATTVAEVAESVLGDLKAAMGVELAAINFVHDESIMIIATPAADPDAIDRHNGIGLDANLPGPVAIRTNSPVVLDSMEEIQARFPEVTTSSYIVESIAALPIRSGNGTVLGALVVGSPERHWIDQAALGLLLAIAGQTGQALDRASLHEAVVEAREKEHAIAVRLQRALLPEKVVQHPTMSISANYIAANDLMSVGGDWYDTFMWSTDRVGVVVGDVVGHDIAAATVMGQLRAGVAALASFTEPEPEAVLAAYDHCVRNNGNTFATAASVVVDTAAGTVAYSLAGHPPPLLVHPDGTSSWLDEALSPPLSSYETYERRKATARLQPGSTIVMYSDGLVERRGESLGVGLARLQSAVARHRAATTEQLSALLIEELTGETDVRDDIIVVCARWNPASA